MEASLRRPPSHGCRSRRDAGRPSWWPGSWAARQLVCRQALPGEACDGLRGTGAQSGREGGVGAERWVAQDHAAQRHC